MYVEDDPIEVPPSSSDDSFEDLTMDDNSSGEGSKDQEKTLEREKIGRCDQIFNKKKRRWEFLKNKEADKKPKNRFTKYVILVRTMWSKDGPDRKEIDIKGPRLQQVLSDVNEQTEGFVLHKSKPVVSREILFHSKGAFEKALEEAKAAEERDETLIFELEAAVEFVEDEFHDELSYTKDLLPKRVVTWDMLWTIYKPNAIIIGQDEFNQTYGLKFGKATYGREGATPHLDLSITYIDHNGKSLGVKKGSSRRILGFYGSKSLDDLSILPLELKEDCDTIKESLLAQGRRAMEFHGRHLVEYRGHALREGKEDFNTGNRQIIKFNSHGRVMLDPENLVSTVPYNSIFQDDLELLTSEELSNEQILVITPRLYGFDLSDKLWGIFALARTKPVEWNNSIFANLVLAQDRKDMITDLIQAQASGDFDFDDFVRAKGQGLVGLLAGPPGVGKTMTAEAIAEVAQRPLYALTSGELGEAASEIQEHLQPVLERAALWNAVLLLDEADVFLFRRDDHDIARNAIVSIFLRELEYYQGILILTTNRMQSFDPAFQSRIHFCINYDDLDFEGRRSIWRSFVGRARANPKLKVEIGDADLWELAELDLNGRQIKNVMSISQKVAARREQPLTLQSLKVAIEMCQNFVIGQAGTDYKVSWANNRKLGLTPGSLDG